MFEFFILQKIEFQNAERNCNVDRDLRRMTLSMFKDRMKFNPITAICFIVMISFRFELYCDRWHYTSHGIKRTHLPLWCFMYMITHKHSCFLKMRRRRSYWPHENIRGISFIQNIHNVYEYPVWKLSDWWFCTVPN